MPVALPRWSFLSKRTLLVPESDGLTVLLLMATGRLEIESSALTLLAQCHLGFAPLKALPVLGSLEVVLVALGSLSLRSSVDILELETQLSTMVIFLS